MDDSLGRLIGPSKHIVIFTVVIYYTKGHKAKSIKEKGTWDELCRK
jgi:hypothetical protein